MVHEQDNAIKFGKTFNFSTLWENEAIMVKKVKNMIKTNINLNKAVGLYQ